MKIFLGSLYPQQLFDELVNRKQFVDYPANVFQLSLLKGLDAQYQDLNVISSPVIRSSYFAVRDICKREFFSHRESGQKNDLYVGTFPVFGFQMFTELKRVYGAIQQQIKGEKQDNLVFIYALHSPFLLATVLLRNRIDCSCVIIPDLPEFMSKQDGIIKKIAKKIDRTIINYCLKRIDCFVLLSPHMRDKLPIKDKPWTLMEGIFDVDTIPEKKNKSTDRIILYCGNISKRYGIIDLLDAFHSIDKDNYRLWICGSGDGESEVVRMSKIDNRIKYLGIVNHNEVMTLQQQATVLINPRSSRGEYTKYSFPSKTMEYLASGTPTIMCHLPAIPKEYDDYIYYIIDESVNGIKDKILEVCEKPQQELNEFGGRASEFIKTQKKSTVQAKKIVDLVKHVLLIKQNNHNQ